MNSLRSADTQPNSPFLHRFKVIPDPETGEYIIIFPSLVGCGVIVGSLDEIGVAAYREYQRWITERRRGGQPIPASDVIDAAAAFARHTLPRFDA